MELYFTLYLPLTFYLSICLSIYVCMYFSLSRSLLLALSDTRLESEVRNDRCARPAVCTERDETLMQRGSLVRARNFGFPVHRRRLAAHIHRVRRRYELRGSAHRSLVGFPPRSSRFHDRDLLTRKGNHQRMRKYADCLLKFMPKFRNTLSDACHLEIYFFLNDSIIYIVMLFFSTRAF